MLEYIFFDEDVLNRFMAYARQLGLECSKSDDVMGLVAAIPDDLPEEQAELLEQYYDQLQEEQCVLVEQTEGGLIKHAAGIRVTLSDGRPCMIRLEPEMANRLLGCFSIDEVQELVNIVARSIESPDDGPICHPLS